MGRGRDVKVFANARKNPRSFSHENKNAWSIKSHFRKRLKRMEKMAILLSEEGKRKKMKMCRVATGFQNGVSSSTYLIDCRLDEFVSVVILT